MLESPSDERLDRHQIQLPVMSRPRRRGSRLVRTERQALPSETGQLTCVRCHQEVRVNRDSYDIFERMHWVCFHYEFEPIGFDPDEECNAPGCPSSRFRRSAPEESPERAR